MDRENFGVVEMNFLKIFIIFLDLESKKDENVKSELSLLWTCISGKFEKLSLAPPEILSSKSQFSDFDSKTFELKAFKWNRKNDRKHSNPIFFFLKRRLKCTFLKNSKEFVSMTPAICQDIIWKKNQPISPVNWKNDESQNFFRIFLRSARNFTLRFSRFFFICPKSPVMRSPKMTFQKRLSGL